MYQEKSLSNLWTVVIQFSFWLSCCTANHIDTGLSSSSSLFNPAIINYQSNATEYVSSNVDLNFTISNNDIVCNTSTSTHCRPANEEPDLNMSPLDMIKFRDFISEEYFVTTKDCYILSMFRIRHPAYVHLQQRPLLLGHGILGNSVNFMFNSLGGSVRDQDDHNLAFALARRGYDVWLGNFRGSAYSKKHVKWNADKEKQYWNFSIDEHALFDLPAFIAQVQKTTNQNEMGYVGFSQGTMVMFYLQAMHPELSEVIRPFVAIAPISRLHNTRHPIRNLASNPLLKRLFRSLGELNLRSRLTNLAVDLICHSYRNLLPFVCGNMMKITIGHHGRLNFTRLPVYLKNFPDSTSAQNVMHFGQMLTSGQFQMFDFGDNSKNVQCYAKNTPLAIDLSKIRSDDIHLIYSAGDLFSDVQDVENLKKSLKVRVKEYKVPIADWSHIDFLIGLEVDKYTNQVVIDMLNRHYMHQNQIISGEQRPLLPVYDHSTCQMKNKCEIGLNNL